MELSNNLQTLQLESIAELTAMHGVAANRYGPEDAITQDLAAAITRSYLHGTAPSALIGCNAMKAAVALVEYGDHSSSAQREETLQHMITMAQTALAGSGILTEMSSV